VRAEERPRAQQAHPKGEPHDPKHPHNRRAVTTIFNLLIPKERAFPQ
jgi:hypothetical protein